MHRGPSKLSLDLRWLVVRYDRVMSVHLLILVAVLFFGVLLTNEILDDRKQGVKSFVFGVRWTFVGLYVVLVEEAISSFPGNFWDIMSLLLAVVALGSLDAGLKRLVDKAGE